MSNSPKVKKAIKEVFEELNRMSKELFDALMAKHAEWPPDEDFDSKMEKWAATSGEFKGWTKSMTPDDKNFMDSFNRKKKELDIHSPEFLRQT